MRNNQTYRHFLLIFAALFLASIAYAQKSNKRYSEADIMAEKAFIEADALFLLEKYEEATVAFEAFIKDYPKVAMAHFQLGRAYSALKETNKCLSSIKKAIDLDAQNRWFLIELAKVYESNGQADQSAEVMVNLTEVEPQNDFAYKKAAFYYLLAQNPDKAIDILEKGESKIGFDPEIHYRKYVIYLAQGKTDKGIQSLQKILKHHPKNTEYRLQLAETFEANKNEALAEKEYRRILEYDPYNAEALVGLQRRTIALGDNNSQGLYNLIANSEISIDLKIVELVPLIQKATPLSTESKKQEWSKLVDKLIEIHPADAKSYSVSGDLYYAIGNNKKALEAYQKTLEKEKLVYPVWQQVLELLFIKKEYTEVIKTANLALDFFPNKSKLTLFLAEAQYRNGAVKKAISNYQQAGIISGRNTHQKRFIYARLSEIYLSQSNSEKAKKYLNKAVLLDDIQDPHVTHLKKEIKQQKLIPYNGKWLQVFPFGVLLK